MSRKLVLLTLLVGLGLIAAPVFAAQIYVCTGCTAPPGGDPNFIDPASINIGFAGNHDSVAPLLVIVGVPDAGSAPTISLPSGVNPAAAGTYYGLHNATSGGLTGVLEGSLTSSSSPPNAYAVAGLNTGAGGGASESFVNWTTSPFPNGSPNPDVGVTSFNIYAYAIGFALNSGPGGNSPITIDFSGLAVGDYVIAYNCAVSGSTCTDGNIGETPFTNAGTPAVPEPSTLLLLGGGLVGLAGIRRWKAGR